MQDFRNNNLVFKIIVITFLFIGWLYSNSLEKKNNKELFSNSFVGVIYKKNDYRVSKINCADTHVKNRNHIIYATAELYENAEVGDTIKKLPNSNYCILTNKGKNLKIKCYFDLPIPQ
ncbi:hypothetical protein SAMN05421847_2822 [Halpernia humi]|uniref:Uncharacterized protein n=1 Tax=Halpernia humi TaxID=493375 RepID=A0A1H6BDP2_9FLAO|nr:hypothetical protein [Halpernia humi]SEG58782.1 hypothetical protein SAMN05421847_2822 [Halpernia humi]